jgi:hypothetical protein
LTLVSKSLKDYAEVGLLRALNKNPLQVNCPGCTQQIIITNDAKETNLALRTHALLHPNSRHVYDVLLSRAMTKIAKAAEAQ